MQNILQHLFQADTLGEVPRERLEAMVEEYPSFGIAHYLLSSKLRTEQADHFEEETRRTNLYFTNPLWLQWMLKEESPVPAMEERPVMQAVTEHWIEEPKPEYTEQVHWQEPEHPQPEQAAPAEEPVSEEPAEPAPWEEPVTEQAAEMEPVAEIQEARLPVAEPEVEAQEIQQPIVEHVAEAQADPEPTPQPIAEPAKAEPRIVEPPLVFESYHMIDYFASQGIKLAPEENPADRLGKQLKSFTEWLKVMKRLPQKDTVTTSDIIAENKIQAIAAHSIEGREVVTETMAEVLAMQGMREKASEVYHKLSLLNPEKSGYFAEKIEQLKTN